MTSRAKNKRGATSSSLAATSSDSEKIALVAGGGRIPELVAQELADRGQLPFVAMLEGDASPALEAYDHIKISTALIGKLITELQHRKINKLVFVGSVKGRPKWTDFRPDWITLRLMSRIARGLRSGDDVLLTKVINAVEEEGISVVGVHDILPHLLAAEGVIAGNKPTRTMLDSIKIGADAAMRLGALDAGQGVVVIGKRIVALEGAEGTDEMLARVADLRLRGKLPTKKGGILIKLCKPQQDRRVDMPTIGPATVDNTANAGLKGIAIHAGNALISDVEDVVVRAQTHGLFVYGIAPEQSEAP